MKKLMFILVVAALAAVFTGIRVHRDKTTGYADGQTPPVEYGENIAPKEKLGD